MIVPILEYVKDVNEIKYNIDIDFVEELLDFVIKDECCIHHNMLVKYAWMIFIIQALGNELAELTHFPSEFYH